MKKVLLLGIVLCICFGMLACTATDPDNLFETPQGSTGSTAPSGTESTQTEPEEFITYTGTYPYGNMQKNIPPGDFVLFGNEVVFSQVQNGKNLLYCYDLNMEAVRLYCEDATCDHKTCAAADLQSNLEVYNGDLYGIKKIEELIDSRVHIFCLPVVANGNTAEVITSSYVNSFIHHEDKMYIRTADASLVVLEDGQKEPRMILEEYNGTSQVIFGNYLYAATFGAFVRVDLTAEKPQEEVLIPDGSGMTDGQHIYYVDEKTGQLYRCDMDGSNAQLLVEQPVLLTSINFDDEYFYYRLYTDRKLNGTADSCDIYRFPKNDPTQIEKIVTLPVSAYQVFTVPGTGKIFVTTHAPQGESRPLYVMNTDGSDMKLLEIPEY